MNDKVFWGDNVSEGQHISILKNDGFPVSFEVLEQANGTDKIQTMIHGSMIVGRGDFCDLSLDDLMISRQHFELKYDGSKLLITDLETLNGTKVNGEIIKKDYPLEAGDVISVGNTHLKITW